MVSCFIAAGSKCPFRFPFNSRLVPRQNLEGAEGKKNGNGLPIFPRFFVAHRLKSVTPRRKGRMRKYLASLVFAGCGLIAASPLSAANPPKEARTAESAGAVQQMR